MATLLTVLHSQASLQWEALVAAGPCLPLPLPVVQDVHTGQLRVLQLLATQVEEIAGAGYVWAAWLHGVAVHDVCRPAARQQQCNTEDAVTGLQLRFECTRSQCMPAVASHSSAAVSTAIYRSQMKHQGWSGSEPSRSGMSQVLPPPEAQV